MNKSFPHIYQNKKMMPLPQLLERLTIEKEQGKTIVLTGGCFDIFHIGHLEYLTGSSRLGDLLVVAVNSDHSIIQYKKQRPLFPVQERCALLAALEVVDFVISFDEPTVHEVLKGITPDYFTKGIDYAARMIPEEELASAIGCKIHLIGDEKKSSSSFIREIWDSSL